MFQRMLRHLGGVTGVAAAAVMTLSSVAYAGPLGPRPTLFSTAAPLAGGTEGDIYTPGDAGPTADVVNDLSGLPPQVAIHESAPGFASNHLGLPGTGLQVDAFSRGDDMDRQIPAGIHGIAPGKVYSWLFSVDTYAQGDSGAVQSESAGDGASADVFLSHVAVDGSNVVSNSSAGLNELAYDADGSLGYPSLGLTENDDLDALDVSYASHPGAQVLSGSNYFSLDPASAATVGGGSGADVFVSTGGGSSLSTFATFSDLGLGFTDDIDALILADNGNGTYDEPDSFFDWTDMSSDMLLFSLAPNSPMIGSLDAVRNLTIEPGDILSFVGGSTNGIGIFLPAEDLGLQTIRSGDAISDNLNAMDVVPEPSTYLMGAMALCAMGFYGLRRRQSAA